MASGQAKQAKLGLEAPDFYIVGYERLTIDELFALLKDAGVHCLADVRDSPRSRVRSYNRNILEESLDELGSARSYPIKYMPMSALGTPPEIRKSGRPMGEMMALYRSRLQDMSKELDDLRDIIKSCKTVLMCYEADPADCHWSELAAAMAERYGLTYADLRK